jgi:predicted amidohydrolase YtcJ
VTLTIRNVEIAGRPGQDVRIERGRIAAIGAGLPRDNQDLDGRGGALIPGLCDHHIHLFALAARADSVALDDVTDAAAFAERIKAAAAARPEGAWIRVLNYHEVMAGELTRHELDALAPRHRLRVQHQTGALWILNSAALVALGNETPSSLDRETGRILRGDAWLRERIGSEIPPFVPIGRDLARRGITSVTDASVTTDADAAAILASAVRAGDLPVRLTLMSGGALTAPEDGAFAVGPVKILLDDHTLPPLDDFIDRIRTARGWNRPVAVHCVTAGELALTLAAFHTAGSRAGDRIEHGGVIPPAAISQIRQLALTIVTQSAFIHERGDRYLAQVDAVDIPDLYRCRSLIEAGVPVAGSSDAPYASPDPWRGIATAIDRRSANGSPLGVGETLSAEAALNLYLGDASNPGGPPRGVHVGAVADLCLLDAPLAQALQRPDAERVRATILAGALTYQAD